MYSEKYDDEDDFFDQLMAELGPDKPLEKQLLRVRKEKVKPQPIEIDLMQITSSEEYMAKSTIL